MIDDLQAVGRPCDEKKPCGPKTRCSPTSNLCVTLDGDAETRDAGSPDRSRDLADTSIDRRRPDIVSLDVLVPDGGLPKATCGANAKLAFSEIAVGAVDYLSIINLGSATINLRLFRVITSGGVPNRRADYIIPLSKKLVPGQLVYVFENAAGVGADLNTGADIPFTAASNTSASLFDASGRLIDHVAIGAKAVDQPSGATFGPNPVPIPSSLDTTAESYRRAKYKGRCPHFYEADWKVGTLTRP